MLSRGRDGQGKRERERVRGFRVHLASILAALTLSPPPSARTSDDRGRLHTLAHVERPEQLLGPRATPHQRLTRDAVGPKRSSDTPLSHSQTSEKVMEPVTSTEPLAPRIHPHTGLAARLLSPDPPGTRPPVAYRPHLASRPSGGSRENPHSPKRIKPVPLSSISSRPLPLGIRRDRDLPFHPPTPTTRSLRAPITARPDAV